MTEPALAASARALLAVCAAPESDHSALFGRFDAAEWERFEAFAELQRVTPLASRALRRAGFAERAPARLAARLDAGYRWQALYGLKQIASLGRTVALLERHGIAAVALKGVRLAWQTYTDPALRPLRDLDLLVPRDDAERAQALLLAQTDYAAAPWAGHYGIGYSHQLPEIVDTAHDVTIEIHHRIFSRGWIEEPALLARIRTEAEPLTLAGCAVSVPSAHANLLHLVEHATLHHMFDNGPQVLADMHFAARSGEIDWPRFSAEADALGLLRSLRLIAALAARHGAQWVPRDLLEHEAPDAYQCATAEAALLRSRHVRREIAFRRRLQLRTGESAGWRSVVAAALRPDPTKLAEIAGSRADSRRRWLVYPIWLARRAGLFLRSRTSSRQAERQVALLDWLNAPGR